MNDDSAIRNGMYRTWGNWKKLFEADAVEVPVPARSEAGESRQDVLLHS